MRWIHKKEVKGSYHIIDERSVHPSFNNKFRLGIMQPSSGRAIGSGTHGSIFGSGECSVPLMMMHAFTWQNV